MATSENERGPKLMIGAARRTKNRVKSQAWTRRTTMRHIISHQKRLSNSHTDGQSVTHRRSNSEMEGMWSSKPMGRIRRDVSRSSGVSMMMATGTESAVGGDTT